MHYVRIDPSNAFRLVVKVSEKFHNDMSTKIIWGPSQTLSVWVLNNESVGSEWKVRMDEHF